MRAACHRLIAQPRFQQAVVGLIVFNAALMGLETSPAVMAAHGVWLGWLNRAVQGLFVLELSARLVAAGSLRRFLADGWNAFDLTVVAISLLPVAGPFAGVARLARILRVARLVSASPELRLIVATMLRSIPSLGHVVVLLGVLLYVYAIGGFYLFGVHDPARWGTLGSALLSLFQILTLEGWPEMQAALLGPLPWAWLYFASFVVLAVFVVINLFIAVVINNLQVVQAEARELADGRAAAAESLASIRAVREHLDRLERGLREAPR
ncbi:MAG: ion transporter [Deltaproteobacteria bacterium]|nr:ion transporter [Deltaproteobacteria bacterium]